jgi:hypothetical protein
MKTNKNIIIIILLFSFVYIVKAQEERFNSEWLEIDKKVFLSLSEYISKDEFKIKPFEEEVIGLEIATQSRLWYGCERTTALQFGGYIGNSISIASKNKKIFYFKVLLDIGATKAIKRIAKDDKSIKNSLINNWKLLAYKSKDSSGNDIKIEQYQFLYENNDLKKSFTKSIDNYLGEKTLVKIDSSLIESYSLLMDPYSIYNYGEYCQPREIKPSGRIAIEELIKAKRFDLIKNVLRGYNPEGRAYAIEALVKYHSKNKINLDENDKQVIQKLTKSHLSVYTCTGCFIEKKSYKEIYTDLLIHFPLLQE